MGDTQSSILPTCLKKDNLINNPFIELDGTFVPCCWLTTGKYKIEQLKELYGEEYEKLNIKNNSVNQIITMWDKIANTWTTETPFSTCLEVCKKEK